MLNPVRGGGCRGRKGNLPSLGQGLCLGESGSISLVVCVCVCERERERERWEPSLSTCFLAACFFKWQVWFLHIFVYTECPAQGHNIDLGIYSFIHSSIQQLSSDNICYVCDELDYQLLVFFSPLRFALCLPGLDTLIIVKWSLVALESSSSFLQSPIN